MQKKAQVTLFIIIAIVILAAIGILIYVERDVLKSLWQGGKAHETLWSTFVQIKNANSVVKHLPI